MWFHEEGTEEKYKPVTLLLSAFIYDLYRDKRFLSIQYVLFLRDMIWFYVTVGAMNDNFSTTDLPLAWHTILKLKYEPFAHALLPHTRI